ncbi:MAG: MarR family transcriptional regulator [Actinomycetia bacterium]|nr:MarR family transcriptional regulator [Actinomycetes bacterium]
MPKKSAPGTRKRGTPRIDADRLAAWRAFLELHHRVTVALSEELESEADLPLPWYDVLVQLEEAPDGRRRMQDLADGVLFSPSGLTRLVDRMERAGLVTRTPYPGDRRGAYAVLTDAGRARLKATAGVHLRGVREHFADRLDDADAATLGRILTSMLEPGSGPPS